MLIKAVLLVVFFVIRILLFELAKTWADTFLTGWADSGSTDSGWADSGWADSGSTDSDSIFSYVTRNCFYILLTVSIFS